MILLVDLITLHSYASRHAKLINGSFVVLKRDFVLVMRDQWNSRDIQPISVSIDLRRDDRDGRCAVASRRGLDRLATTWHQKTDTVAKCQYKVCLIEGLVHTTHLVPFPRPTNWSTSKLLPSRDPGGIVWRPAAAGASRSRSCDTKRGFGSAIENKNKTKSRNREKIGCKSLPRLK